MYYVFLDSVFIYLASINHRVNYINCFLIFCVFYALALWLSWWRKGLPLPKANYFLEIAKSGPGAHFSYVNQPIASLQLQPSPYWTGNTHASVSHALRQLKTTVITQGLPELFSIFILLLRNN